MITVQQLLDSKPHSVVTIAEEVPVQEALELMARHKISALPVVSGSRLAGIVSERDYIRKAVPKRVAPWDITVGEIMTRDVFTVARSDSINACMDLMCANRIRHLPVMHGEALVGMLSITDVLRALRGAPGA
ncbi:MAG: CBS domain-containing protein [Burkholderiales bacterium]|nr:CBS domain-containing protein [Pseudomonadota bacterium]